MRPKKPFPIFVCSLALSVGLIIGGIVLFCVWPILLDYLITSNLKLEPGSHTHDLWKKFPEPLKIDFYFFNWTNPHELYNASCKPRVEEVGPYSFWETKEKSDVVWNNQNGTVTFRHLKKWFFNRDGGRSLEDVLTTVNPVALSAAYSARDWSYLVRKGFSISMITMQISAFSKHTVSEMLFDGYPDPLISMGKQLPFLSASLPPWDKFGWFYTRNGSSTYEGIFNMGTGLGGSDFGRLYSWNNWQQTPYYEGECGKIKGSAGEFFPLPKDSISFFSPDMCRTLQLDHTSDVVVADIIGKKFTMGPNVLDNGTLQPGNECFCNGECVPSGAVNVSSCRYGSPSFASLPHFYNADSYYMDLIDGLRPDRKKHEFFITLEPTTGIPLEVSARLQINLLMQPIKGVSLYEKVPRVFFPMLWFEQKVQVPDSEAFKLRLLLNLPVICSSIGILMICGGLILLSCAVYKICTTNICGKDNARLKKNKNCLYEAEQQVPLKSGATDGTKDVAGGFS